MKVVNLDKLLPADIPPDESVVWFGRPDPVSLWRRAYRADVVALYFAGLAIWSYFTTAVETTSERGLISALIALAWGVAALAILGGLAWGSARTTLYVVTTKRVIMKVGIALPIFHNIPFTQIRSAGLRPYGDGTGDIALALTGGQRIAYLVIWPSTRPFHFRQPEPMLRSIAKPRDVAEKVARAMIEANGGKAGSAVKAPQAAQAFATAATA